MNKMEHEYVWGNKEYRNLIVNLRTGKRAKHRKIKERFCPGDRKKLVHGLQLKPGDIIQTCFDYFNHEIVSIKTDYYHPFNYKIDDEDAMLSEARDVTIFCEKGKQHSWMSCCSPALTVLEIEKEYNKEVSFDFDYYLMWYGNKEEAEAAYTKHKNFEDKLKSRIAKGLPITNEYGILLSELQERP